jgi:CubicO group peptidase (beta-lactamase class C family)
MQEKLAPARTEAAHRNNATEAAIQEAIQKSQWGRFLQLTRSPAAITGTPAERGFRLFLRCHAARAIHDRREFERSMIAFRREMARMTAKERTPYVEAFASGQMSPAYQNPKFRPRPTVLLPTAALEQRGLDPEAVETLHTQARDTFTDAVYLWHDGKIVLEDYFDAPQEPIPVMSITKPVVAMAVGRLLDTGRLKSLDQLVSEFYPEWKKHERKSRITLRHLLTHTSGLPSGEEWAEGRAAAELRAVHEDYVRSSRAFPAVAAPGERWAYCNAGLMLLADITRRASGKRLDAYVRQEFFTPMGIRDFRWGMDPKGNINGAGGLALRAHDLAKFGVLMLNGGVWKGRRLLSQQFVAESLRHQTKKVRSNGMSMEETPPMGLIWWLGFAPKSPNVMFGDQTLQSWRRIGAPEKVIAKMLPHKGKVMPEAEYEALVKRLLGIRRLNDRNGWRTVLNTMHYPVIADPADDADAEQRLRFFHHGGTAGQELIILPGHRLVGVRQAFVKNLSDRGIDAEYPSFASDVADCCEYPIRPSVI